MAAISFLLKSKSDTSPIYVRLIDGRAVDVMAKTRYSIKASDWSREKQRPLKMNDADYKALNQDLHDFKSDLLKHYNKCNGKVVINTKWLKDFINPPAVTGELPESLVKYFDSYISIKKKNVSANSIKKYNVIKHKLEKFQKELKYEIMLKDVNSNFQKEFEAFCDREGYAHNTITMEMRFIKTVCRHAQKNGLSISPQMEAIENKYVEVDNIYLNEQELEMIKGAELNEYLDNARDWLLISCYTAARVSDLLRFNSGMLRREEGRYGKIVVLLEYEQVKTKKIMTIPLHKEVVAILEKRNGEFPRAISDQKYNDYIKKVCRKSGITYQVPGSKKEETFKDSGIYRKTTGIFPKCDLVTSHIGRRSFATNFYSKVPTSLIIAATGHSTEAMLHTYLKKSPSDRAKELAEYF